MQSLELEGGLMNRSISRYKVKVDDIVKEIPFGRFQILMIATFCFIYSSPSIVVYNYAFFLMFPHYLCTDTVGGPNYQCTRD